MKDGKVRECATVSAEIEGHFLEVRAHVSEKLHLMAVVEIAVVDGRKVPETKFGKRGCGAVDPLEDFAQAVHMEAGQPQ